PGTPYSVVPNGWSKEGGSGAWLTHSGCVIENNGGTTESGYWTPTRPGATSTIIASPTKRRKITRPATAVRFAKKTLAESFHSSKRPFSSLMVSMHSLVPDSRVQEAIQDVKDQRREDENNPKNEGRSDRKSTRLNSSHVSISYAVFCLKKKIEQLKSGRSRAGD